MLPVLNPSEVAAVAAVVVCSLIGMAVRSESRLLLGGLAVAVLTGSPAAVVGWAVMALMIHGVRLLWIGL